MCEFEQVEAYLPEVVKEMIGVIDFPATEKVIKAFGGVDFYFSLGKQYFPKLVEVIGIEQATKLQEYFSRERLYIPRCEAALKVLRNQRFRVEFQQVKAQKQISSNLVMLELCPKYGISERHAWDILNHQEAIEQQSLFGSY